jgi:HD-like signal output (HDOD) protein
VGFRRLNPAQRPETAKKAAFHGVDGPAGGQWIMNTVVFTQDLPKRVADMDHTYIPAFTLEPPKRAAEAPQASASRTPRFIDDVAAGRVELPTIPRVVQRLIAALRDPDVDSRKIGEALSQDPVLSAKVLRVANSSFFGGQRSMASIDAAVALIGTQALNRLIVACGVSGTFKEIGGIDLRIFWRDALVAATAANKLAPRLAADPEEAYVCGLLHATGHLILCQSYPEIADAMFKGFAVVRGAELATIELEAFGIDHPTVGALWVESIGFPQSVSDTIGNTARALADAPTPLDLTLRSACSLAAAVARSDAADVALAALPPKVRALFSAADGTPDAAFTKLYDALCETEPSL